MPEIFTKTSCFLLLLIIAQYTTAQDGTIYPFDAPEEPNAILLGTGGVDDQPASESWFRQWGDPMARNITTPGAMVRMGLTFFAGGNEGEGKKDQQKPGKKRNATGATVIHHGGWHYAFSVLRLIIDTQCERDWP